MSPDPSHATRLGELAIELARLFAAQSTPTEFCRAALGTIERGLRATSGTIVFFGRDDDAEATIVAEGGSDGRPGSLDQRALSRSVLDEIRSTGKTVLVTDARASSFHRETSIIALDMRSILATPLRFDDRVAGAIHLENASMTDAFVESDRLLLEAISSLLSPFLEVGRRLDTALRDRERLSAESAKRPGNDLVGRGPAMNALQDVIARVAGTDAPVLIMGESGSGKELVARALHAGSKRSAGPLVAVNCAAIPENLMESELFGHEKGAFTGATERRKGRFEQAHGGTLFLDEVGELRAELQAKLLRVLQDRMVERVGGSQPLRVDVRVIAATHRNLKQLVAEGKFREDLFYRLDVVPVNVPALRERPEDLPLLIDHFLVEARESMGRHVRLAPDVVESLSGYRFPGNVRELRNIVHRLVALATGDVVTAADLPEGIAGERTVSLEKDPFRKFLRAAPRTNDDLKATRDEMQALLDGYVRRLEKQFLETLLEESGGNIAQAARLAGMNRTLFHKKLKD